MMKKTILFAVLSFIFHAFSFSQNVGIGTVAPLEKLHVVGNKAYFQTNFVGIGTNSPTTSFTGFAMKNNVNTFYGMYVDAGPTGQPFYGFALNGVPIAYSQFNGAANQFEYYHTNGGTPDFLISNTQVAFPATSFLGIGTLTPTNSYTGLSLKSAQNSYWGMYVDAGLTGLPFYGWALNGVPKAYSQFNSGTNAFEYHQSGDVTPDFLINGNTKAVFNTGFVGINTSTPTTSYTGFAMKNNVNTFYGSYIDAGLTGSPFYGYALNGVPIAYTSFNGSTSRYEYHRTSDGLPDFYVGATDAAFPITNFLGIGTTTPTSSYTGLALKSAANSYWGMYVDAGSTGLPFYGYALNGVPRAYTQFHSTNNQFEYHQTSDVTPDFLINGNTRAVFNTGFVGINTSTPTTGFTGFAMKSNVNTYYGAYVDAGPTGIPFYGYALNGVATAYTTYNGSNNRFEYHHTQDANPDFFISNTQAAFPIQTFLGLGTTTPTTGYTGFAMKSNVNNYYGAYVDAGATGIPFYGYALNGVATAYTTYNGVNNRFEYHHTQDANPDFFISNTQAAFPIQTFLGVGTSIPTTGSATGMTIKNNVNGFYGMYIDAGATGRPFYGYALNGSATAWTELNGSNNNWEMNYSGARIDVTSAGNVGIGTAAPAQKLDVAGTIHASNLNGGATTLSTDASGNIIRTVSDARLKKDIQPIGNALEKVMQMRGITYNFKDPARFGNTRQMGFLAQDLEKITPEAVSSGGEYKSVNYPVLTAVLAEAIKEQQKEIEMLMKRIEKLEKK